MRSRRTRVALMTAVMLITAACSSNDSTNTTTILTTTTVVTTQPPTTTAPSTSTTTTAAEPLFTVDDALSVADAYFEAYNAGDVEAVLGLFEPDATFSDSFGSQTRTDWEQLVVWNAAQGTTLSPPDCTVTEEVPGLSMTLSCSHFNHDALVQALDGAPVPITLTLTVTPDGISQWRSIFGFPTFNIFASPFRGWMKENHPEDEFAVGFGNWTSVKEAEQNGILTAHYADEWATYLEANGCTYREGC